MVEEKREDREIVELDETREAVDMVMETEFPEDSTSGKDASRWIIPYDPSSSQVLLWKGQLIARLMKNANLSCKETAIKKKVLVEDVQQAAGDESHEEEDESSSSDSESSDEEETRGSIILRQMLAKSVEKVQRENLEATVGEEQANTLPEGNDNEVLAGGADWSVYLIE